MFLSFVNESKTQVNVLSCQHAIAVDRIRQRKFLVMRLCHVPCKLKFIDDRVYARLTERALQGHVRNQHRTLRTSFQNELIAEGSNHRVNWVVLVVIDARLHGPLKSVGSEAVRLVEQLWDEVIRAIGQQLKI